MGNLSRGIRISNLGASASMRPKQAISIACLPWNTAATSFFNFEGILPLIECGNRDISQLFNFTVSDENQNTL